MLPSYPSLIHGESLSALTFQKTPFQRLQSFPEPLEQLELLERLEPWTSTQTHSPLRRLEIQSIFVTSFREDFFRTLSNRWASRTIPTDRHAGSIHDRLSRPTSRKTRSTSRLIIAHGRLLVKKDRPGKLNPEQTRHEDHSQKP